MISGFRQQVAASSSIGAQVSLFVSIDSSFCLRKHGKQTGGLLQCWRRRRRTWQQSRTVHLSGRHRRRRRRPINSVLYWYACEIKALFGSQNMLLLLPYRVGPAQVGERKHSVRQFCQQWRQMQRLNGPNQLAQPSSCLPVSVGGCLVTRRACEQLTAVAVHCQPASQPAGQVR